MPIADTSGNDSVNTDGHIPVSSVSGRSYKPNRAMLPERERRLSVTTEPRRPECSDEAVDEGHHRGRSTVRGGAMIPMDWRVTAYPVLESAFGLIQLKPLERQGPVVAWPTVDQLPVQFRLASY